MFLLPRRRYSFVASRIHVCAWYLVAISSSPILVGKVTWASGVCLLKQFLRARGKQYTWALKTFIRAYVVFIGVRYEHVLVKQ